MSQIYTKKEGCKNTVKDLSSQNLRVSTPVDDKITLNMNQMDKRLAHWCL